MKSEKKLKQVIKNVVKKDYICNHGCMQKIKSHMVSWVRESRMHS